LLCANAAADATDNESAASTAAVMRVILYAGSPSSKKNTRRLPRASLELQVDLKI
jgi:hypothetical protein